MVKTKRKFSSPFTSQIQKNFYKKEKEKGRKMTDTYLINQDIIQKDQTIHIDQMTAEAAIELEK